MRGRNQRDLEDGDVEAACVQPFLNAQLDVQETLAMVRFKGGVEWRDLVKLEAVHWVFVLVAMAFCVVKGPRLFSSTRSSELGIFMPFGLRGLLSFQSVLHLFVSNVLASLISMGSVGSVVGRTIRDWKIGVVKLMASAMAAVLAFEFIILNPACSQIALWPSWSTIVGWWKLESSKPFDDVDFAEIKSNVADKVDKLTDAMRQVKDRVSDQFIDDSSRRRLFVSSWCSDGVGRVVGVLGGCSNLHQFLWMAPLTLFTYTWLALSLISFPFAIFDDFRQVCPWLFRREVLANFSKTAAPPVSADTRQHYLYEGFIKHTLPVLLQVPDNDAGLPDGYGSWWQRRKNDLTVIDGLWCNGRLKAPYIVRDPSYGIFRAIPMICVDIGATGEDSQIDTGHAVMCNSRLVEISTKTVYSSLSSRHWRSRVDKEEATALLGESVGHWRDALTSILTTWRLHDERLSQTPRSVIWLVHADHSGFTDSGRSLAVHVAGSVASVLSVQSSNEEFSHVHAAATMPMIIVLNLKPTLTQKLLTYALSFKEIDSMEWYSHILSIYRVLEKVDYPIARILGYGIAVEPLLKLSQETKSVKDLVVFGIRDLLLLSRRFELTAGGLRSFMRRSDGIETNIYVLVGKDLELIKLIREYEIGNSLNKDDWLQERVPFANQKLKFFVKKGSVGEEDQLYPSLREMLVGWNTAMRTFVQLYDYLAESERASAWDIGLIESRLMVNPATDNNLDLFFGSTYLYS
eukprot:GHVH01010625.1.p1 GENE.GHVH01010625.1~~GHVH01010625.1.p1  ORF type:complete len:744 (+),score=86.89 GHVH01010625.1:60-2291(+)